MLALLHPSMVRNRALATAYLAGAQLQQGGEACDRHGEVGVGRRGHGRVEYLPGAFTTRLIAHRKDIFSA
ncbi:hypothetical protein AB0K89_02380 [Streptomyces cinnamoneus]|uniref:hypothetical protein n=1 Tax=Streptomyces cinnamoneus TaxID=53446 RepID=UPI003419806E